jgi:hypothetical protein
VVSIESVSKQVLDSLKFTACLMAESPTGSVQVVRRGRRLQSCRFDGPIGCQLASIASCSERWMLKSGRIPTILNVFATKLDGFTSFTVPPALFA